MDFANQLKSLRFKNWHTFIYRFLNFVFLLSISWFSLFRLPVTQRLTPERIRRMNITKTFFCKIKMYFLGYNYLLRSFLSFAHFDGLNGQPTMNKRKRLIINLTIQFVLIVNALKIGLIVSNQRLPNLKFYLLDLFVFEQRYQKVLDIGLAIVQTGLCLCVSNWFALNQKTEVLQCFDFLFVSNRKDALKFYTQRYNLNRRSAEKFLSIYRIFYSLLIPTLIVYGLFVIGLSSRCLYFSYKTVSLT